MIRSLRRRTVLTATLAALAIAGAACSDEGSAAADDDDDEGSTVAVTLKDWSITLDPTSVPAGSITFDTTNEGPTTHEFEIFSGEVSDDPLPVESGVADTTGLTLVDEVEDVVAGATAELPVDLEAGTYLLICNLPDHYEQGMSATVTVT